MENITQFLPFLIPVIIIELALAITAAVHVWKHPNYRFGNKVMWMIVVIFIQIVGPIVYFVFGRGEE